eukprot:RCo053420
MFHNKLLQVDLVLQKLCGQLIVGMTTTLQKLCHGGDQGFVAILGIVGCVKKQLFPGGPIRRSTEPCTQKQHAVPRGDLRAQVVQTTNHFVRVEAGTREPLHVSRFSPLLTICWMSQGKIFEVHSSAIVDDATGLSVEVSLLDFVGSLGIKGDALSCFVFTLDNPVRSQPIKERGMVRWLRAVQDLVIDYIQPSFILVTHDMVLNEISRETSDIGTNFHPFGLQNLTSIKQMSNDPLPTKQRGSCAVLCDIVVSTDINDDCAQPNQIASKQRLNFSIQGLFYLLVRHVEGPGLQHQGSNLFGFATLCGISYRF